MGYKTSGQLLTLAKFILITLEKHFPDFSFGPYFPAFRLKTERYGVYSVRMRENTDQKNS